MKPVRSSQFPPVLLARALKLWLGGRVHFPKTRIGEIMPGEEDFIIFRQVIVDPDANQPEKPGAWFRVWFHFANFSAQTNIILSRIPIPFIIAQPGFRSKTWMLSQETRSFQGLYEWDTLEDAENYWMSFPMKLMKRRAVPETLSYEISEI